MKIAIFGAAGRVGRLLVAGALEQGHDVTAYARNIHRLPLQHARLKKLEGDLRDSWGVAAALEGQEAVFTAHGHTAGRQADTALAGMHSVLEGMQARAIRRLISVSAAGMDHKLGGFFFWGVFQPLLLRASYKDLKKMELAVEASGLDWTLVRPAALADGPASGAYQVAPEEELKGFKIKRADVADFMLKELGEGRWIHHKPALSN